MDTLLTMTCTFGPLTITFLLGFAVTVLFFWYSSHKLKYWKNLGVPYVKLYPFFGSLIERYKKPLHELELERYQKFGRIYGHFESNRPLLSVAEPEILRNILVKDFHAFTGRRNVSTGDKITESMLSVLQGEDWKRVRSIVTPTFTTGKIRRMMNIFKESSRTLIRNFKEAAKEGKPVEAKTIYGAFTMDIIASSAFSTKIDSHNDPNNEFVLSARKFFTINIDWRAMLFILAPWLMKLFKISIAPPQTTNFFANAAKEIMDERKRTGQTRNDFLQLLMDTAKEVHEDGNLDIEEKNDITANYANEENKAVFKSVTKKTLSFEELVGQCVIFFLAGYDTTASTLSFATYFLALNTDVQERVIEEIDSTLQEYNGELTYEAVQSLKTLDNVISETLRIYPPLQRLERVAEENYKLGDTGITIPKGMIVTIPVFAMHRDPEHFPNPEKFDPNRFTQEERAKRHPYSYMPFGTGPRNCIGIRFALMEVKVCLTHVLSNFRVKRCSETKVPLEFYRQGLLGPKEVNVQFEIRKDTVKTL